MGRIFAIFLGAWLAIMPAFAQDQSAIEGVIGDQLQAFNDRDIDRAWDHASPNIQELFGNPSRFGDMVKQGYPMVWDNSDAQFMELRDISGTLWQKVMIRDARGNLHILDYQMIETPDGWQINGVQLLPSPDVSA